MVKKGERKKKRREDEGPLYERWGSLHGFPSAEGMRKRVMKMKMILVFGSALLLGLSSPSPLDAISEGWLELLKSLAPEVKNEVALLRLAQVLPSGEEIAKEKLTSPRELLSEAEAAGPEAEAALLRWLRAWLRELARGKILDPEAVTKVLGREPDGVHGSRFFGIPEIPGESYQALIDYLMAAAAMASPGFTENETVRKKLDRSLYAAFAISSPEVRLQYRDFDLVFAELERLRACPAKRPRPDLPAGYLWLYAQWRDAAGLDFLPPLSGSLPDWMEKESGALFAKAKETVRGLPRKPESILAWKCGP